MTGVGSTVVKLSRITFVYNHLCMLHNKQRCSHNLIPLYYYLRDSSIEFKELSGKFTEKFLWPDLVTQKFMLYSAASKFRKDRR
jgi:hypothetical protein